MTTATAPGTTVDKSNNNTPSPSRSSLSSCSSSSGPLISSSERQYILESCRDNIRLDGRARTECRSYTLLCGNSSSSSSSFSEQKEEGPLVLSNGSARILLAGGATNVLCSVRAELVHPSPLRPNEGVVELHVDTLLGGGHHRRRRQQQQDDYLESALADLLLNHVVDRRGLCVVPHHYVWRLHVDLLVLACHGSLLDVASRVMRAALQRTMLPHVFPIISKQQQQQQPNTTAGGRGAQVDLAMDGDMVHARPPPGVQHCPVVITVQVMHVPAPVLVLDATLEEEACASCQVRVAVDPSSQTVCALDNVGTLPQERVADVTVTAMQAARQLWKQEQQQEEEERNKGKTTKTSHVEDVPLLQDHFRIR